MNGKIIALIAVVATVSFFIFNLRPQEDNLMEFDTFKSEFNKAYKTMEEEEYRKGIFLMNLAKIAAHNADSTQTHSLGVTQFADLTQDEFVNTYLNTRLNEKFTSSENARTANPSNVRLGDVDWVSQGKVSPVKNQGACGSCWAFSTTGSIESAYLLNDNSVLLSEQQLVDCSGAYGNHGCNGGWMDSAFQYVKDHGLQTEQEYPYKAVNQPCAADGGNYKISGFVDVPGCDNLKNALSGRPVSVAVDASTWSLYKSGVLSKCGTAVNHGVLVVGATDDYWKIKNSWSGSWGENGFIRLAAGNTCAVCNYPSYPTL